MQVLVIEDDKEIQEFIQIAFSVGWPGAEVKVVSLGEQGVAFLESNTPDIVILDLGLPDITGYEVIKCIRRYSQIPIIVQTVRDSEIDVVRCLNMGADDYITKPYGQMELLARVRALLRRHFYSHEGQIVRGKLVIDDNNQLIYDGTSFHLTPIEGRIMRLLLEHPNHIVSIEEMKLDIWGDNEYNPVSTIRVHIGRLRNILSKIPCSYWISSTSGIGYTLVIPDQDN